MKIKKEYYQLAVDNAPTHIILTDIDGKILYANKVVEKITGYKIKDIIGKKPNLWGNQMSKEFYQDLWNTIKVKKEKFEGEVINRRKDGKHYNSKIIVQPIIQNNKLVGFAGIEEDVTKLRKAQKTLKSNINKLKKSNQLKEMFISIMQHDILNPLTIIKGYSNNLFKKKKNRELKIIIKSTDKAIDIINAANNYALLNNSKIPKEEIDLKKVIEDVCKHVRPLYKKENVKLINHAKTEMPMMANKLIDEIFLNFLTNALKYASDGKKVIIESFTFENNYIVKVVDFGEGIPNKFKKSIFKRFLRIEKRNVKGTGLGLEIVRKLVKLHHGKVWVEDNPKGGAVFIVSFPIRKS